MIFVQDLLRWRLWRSLLLLPEWNTEFGGGSRKFTLSAQVSEKMLSKIYQLFANIVAFLQKHGNSHGPSTHRALKGQWGTFKLGSVVLFLIFCSLKCLSSQNNKLLFQRQLAYFWIAATLCYFRQITLTYAIVKIAPRSQLQYNLICNYSFTLSHPLPSAWATAQHTAQPDLLIPSHPQLLPVPWSTVGREPSVKTWGDKTSHPI